MNTPTIKTERLILREFTQKDLEDLYKIFSDKEVNTFLPWYPLETIKEAQEFYETQYVEKYSLQTSYHYAICLKEDNVPIGYINVSDDDSYDFGYGLLKEFWHQGIITEGCTAVIKQLQKDGIPYITATHDINNYRSGNVLKKLGMQYQYSYEEQWQPKNILVTFRMYQLNFDGNTKRVYSKYWDKYPNHFIETDL